MMFWDSTRAAPQRHQLWARREPLRKKKSQKGVTKVGNVECVECLPSEF